MFTLIRILILESLISGFLECIERDCASHNCILLDSYISTSLNLFVMVAKFIIEFSIHVRNWQAIRSSYAAYQSSDCGFDSVSNLCPEVLCTLSSIYNCVMLKGKMVVWLPEKFSIFIFAKEAAILSTPDDDVARSTSSLIF